MAFCDYCGSSYRGGAAKDGAYRYCNGYCRDRGKMLMRHLECVPEDQVETKILEAHRGPCPECSRNATIDVYSSYRFWSALIYWRWKGKSIVACRECARTTQGEDLVLSALSGWWSPPGILITPFAIGLNIIAMCRRVDPQNPSQQFRKLVRISLARSLAEPSSQLPAR
jgi:hypothetical protein